MTAEMADLAAAVAPFTAERVDPESTDERSRAAAAALADRPWPEPVVDALGKADPATCGTIAGVRWAVAMTQLAGGSLDALDVAVASAASSGRLDRLSAWADGNLAEVAALMLDPDEWA